MKRIPPYIAAPPLREISNICDRRIEGNIRSSSPESMVPSISPYIAAPLMHVPCGGVRNPHKMTQGQAEADSALHRHSSPHQFGSENA